MEFLLILFLILLYTVQSFFCKVYTDRYPGDPEATTPVFSVISGLVTVLVTLVFALFSLPFHFNWQVILLGVINGVTLAAYNFSMIKASQRGPYSVQMVFMLSGGILLPSFVAFIYGDRLSVWQWLAVAVIVVSIFLVSKKKGEKLSADWLFWVFCIGLFIFNGVYGVLFDIQQNRWAVTANSKNEMIMCTFLTSAVINTILGFVQRKKKFLTDFRQSAVSGVFLILCSLATAFAINLLVFIIPLIDHITVLYTFDNAGVLLFSVLCSFIFLKEKLSVMNLIGCGLMAAGLVGMVLL